MKSLIGTMGGVAGGRGWGWRVGGGGGGWEGGMVPVGTGGGVRLSHLRCLPTVHPLPFEARSNFNVSSFFLETGSYRQKLMKAGKRFQERASNNSRRAFRGAERLGAHTPVAVRLWPLLEPFSVQASQKQSLGLFKLPWREAGPPQSKLFPSCLAA